jgi:hypothetical protein
VENLTIVELNEPEKHENVSSQLKDYPDIGLIIKNIEAKHSKLLKGIYSFYCMQMKLGTIVAVSVSDLSKLYFFHITAF